ncbi:hypothetical protein [Thiorhodococcus mannitoliphagus]|nr:hypothetical protein [Thiorhodococcus mannitoliphagus]
MAQNTRDPCNRFPIFDSDVLNAEQRRQRLRKVRENLGVEGLH